MLSQKKQDTLDSLDRLLGVQTDKREKIKAIREIEKSAKRMADLIEQNLNHS